MHNDIVSLIFRLGQTLEYEVVHTHNDRVISAFTRNDFRGIYDVFVDGEYYASFSAYEEVEGFAKRISDERT